MRAIVLGSSPLALLDAADLAAAGYEVTVHEASARLGGAWAVVEFAGYRDVEIGCHLLERDAVGYQRLREAGVMLAPMEPQPATVLRPGLRRPYVAPSAAAARLAYQPIAQLRRPASHDRAGWKRRRRLAAKELRDAILDRSPVLGLVGGAGALIAALAEHARLAGATIATDSPIRRIEFGSHRPVVLTDDGAGEVELVVLPAACPPETIVLDGVPVAGTPRTRHFHHLLMAFEPGSVEPHSYWRYPRDPALQRSAAITENAIHDDGPARDILLVSVGMHPAPTSTPAVLDRLRAHGTVRTAADPTEVRTLDYAGLDAADLLTDALAGRTDAVVRRSYGDLTRSIAAADHPASAMRLAVTS